MWPKVEFYLLQWLLLLILCYCESNLLYRKWIDKHLWLNKENQILNILEEISIYRFQSFFKLCFLKIITVRVRMNNSFEFDKTGLGSAGLFWRVLRSSMARLISFCKSSSGITNNLEINKIGELNELRHVHQNWRKIVSRNIWQYQVKVQTR